MEQDDLLRFVSDVLRTQGVRHGFTGSQASSLYGENRFTNDIDVVVDIRSAPTLAAFLGQFPAADFYVSDAGARHAIAHGGQFNIIHQDSSQKVDVIIQSDPDWPDELDRCIELPLADGRPVWIISVDDLILHKMAFYREGGSDKHLRDIASMLKVSADCIDRTYVQQWAERRGLADIWAEVLLKVGEPPKQPDADDGDDVPF